MRELDGIATDLATAAFDSARLPDMFDRVAAAFGCEVVTFFSLADGRPDVFGSAAAGAFQAHYQRDGFFALDVVTPAIKRQPNGAIVLSQSFVDEEMRQRHPFFQEFLSAWRSEWGAGWNADIGGERCTFTFSRATPFERAEADALARLAPSFNSAMFVAKNLVAAHTAGLADALVYSRAPSLLLDDRGEVTFATSAAEAHFDDAFNVRHRTLWCADAEGAKRLALVRSAARNRLSEALPVQFPLRRAGRRPLIVSAHRIAGLGLDALGGARVLVAIADLSRPARSDPPLLRATFGLSPREAQVAELLAQGAAPAQIATALGLQGASVRQIVKALMAKTETHRQAELVRLLARVTRAPDADG